MHSASTKAKGRAITTHSIGDRRREIGVRIALGATSAQIMSLVGELGARPALVGLGIGVVASLGISRAMSALVYGVRAFDASVSAGVIALTFAVILAATYLAARRALMVEPLEALKQE